MPSSLGIDFSRRASPSELPELMDGDCTYEDFRDCLRSLAKINRWFLGYRSTLRWLEQMPLASRTAHILDVGSGAGDTLRAIATWAGRRRLSVRLTGLDMNPMATCAAKEFTSSEFDIRWVTGNAMEYRPQEPVDIIVSSLMTHHLEDSEIVHFLVWMEANARVGWFINDLERSALSARLFGWLPWHPIVRHDGPVSFRRAFLVEDWHDLLDKAGIPRQDVTIEKNRPGRLCVGRWK